VAHDYGVASPVFANVPGGTLGATAAYRWQVSRRLVVIVLIAVVAVASGVGWATGARLRAASAGWAGVRECHPRTSVLA
jgi:hypothetical protein